MADERTDQEKMEGRRNAGLYNLTECDALKTLAATYGISNDSNYGSTVEGAMDTIYIPALRSDVKTKNLNSGEDQDLVKDSILGSRQGGKFLSGHISEYAITEEATKVIHQSLISVKVSDVLGLIDYSGDVSESYKDKYLAELINSENEKDKEIAKQIIGTYMEKLTGDSAADALKQRSKNLVGGLERVLNPESIN